MAGTFSRSLPTVDPGGGGVTTWGGGFEAAGGGGDKVPRWPRGQKDRNVCSMPVKCGETLRLHPRDGHRWPTPPRLRPQSTRGLWASRFSLRLRCDGTPRESARSGASSKGRRRRHCRTVGSVASPPLLRCSPSGHVQASGAQVVGATAVLHPGDAREGPWGRRGGCKSACQTPCASVCVCQLRHNRMEQGPTEPHAGHSTFLLSCGGVGGRVLLRGR